MKWLVALLLAFAAPALGNDTLPPAPDEIGRAHV